MKTPIISPNRNVDAKDINNTVANPFKLKTAAIMQPKKHNMTNLNKCLLKKFIICFIALKLII